MSISNVPPRTYGNWRKPRSPGLFGLGSLGTAILLGGLVLTLVATMTGGLMRGLLMLVLEAGLVGAVALRDRHGKNLLDRTLARLGWGMAANSGSHLYRSGPLGMTPWGTHQLPGIAAATRLSEHSDAYGRRFALIYTPAAGTYAVVFAVEPDGASLVDVDQVDAWVAGWGEWLNALGNEPGLKGCSAVVETAPDSGYRLRQEVETNIDPKAPAFAQHVLREVVAAYPLGSNLIRAFITLTFAATSHTGKKRTLEEIGRDIAARIPHLGDGLSATGAGATRPLAAAELCEVIRTAYDPAVAGLIDEAQSLREPTQLTWDEVGPVAADANWDHYRHDSGVSVTWEMTRAPEGTVQSAVLARLLAPHRDLARKRVTLLYRPIDPARAAAIVEADLRAAEFVATTTRKPPARAVVAARAATATAQEEASGAGLVNFGMLVTATVPADTDLSEVRAAVDNLSASARVALRPTYGAQAAGFAAALPLGIVLPEVQSASARLRAKL